MKKLQIALDVFSTEAALEILDVVADYVDIIELGTPLMISEGAHVIKAVKEKYPSKIVFADIKVMDGGSIMANIVFDAGADMVSVLAVADDATLLGVIGTAKEHGRKVLVDMCNVSDMTGRAKEIEKMNPDYICVHVGYDIQATGVDPIEELKKISGVSIPKAMAGGIKITNFENAVKSPAEVVIVGGGLYGQPNMKGIAVQMHEIINKYN